MGLCIIPKLGVSNRLGANADPSLTSTSNRRGESIDKLMFNHYVPAEFGWLGSFLWIV